MEQTIKFIRQINFCIEESIKNFVRSGWMSVIVITTMVSAISIFGGFWLILKDFEYITNNIGSKLQIIAFLKQNSDLDKTYSIVSKIDGIKHVEIITKDKAWKELKSELKNSLELENIGNENPLPDSLQITVNNPEAIELVSSRLKEIETIEEIKYSQELANYIENLSRLIKLVGIIISSILGFATIAIIVNTIRLAVNSRKNEIEIMRLVGATNWIIRLPFLLEGIIFGFFSGIFTSIILIVWRTFSISQIKVLFPFLPILEDKNLVYDLVIYVFLLSIIVGFVGSSFSVHRYLSFEKYTSDN
ncbi:MAG: cell division protein [Candidatus Sericytochromatia bacterium]|nr:MAG: cell division protein [Candidatus Sericytochromatia bacterium]